MAGLPALMIWPGLNMAAGLILSVGAASRQLGLLAATRGRWEQAEAHFKDGMEMNARMGALPWLAHTEHEYARMLVARDEVGDRETALELLSNALTTAEELGMKTLIERCLELKLELQGVSSTNTGASIDAVASLVYAEKPDLRKQAAPDGTHTHRHRPQSVDRPGRRSHPRVRAWAHCRARHLGNVDPERRHVSRTLLGSIRQERGRRSLTLRLSRKP